LGLLEEEAIAEEDELLAAIIAAAAARRLPPIEGFSMEVMRGEKMRRKREKGGLGDWY